MVAKEILCPQRIRKNTGSFAFIEHRFLQRGYWGRLGHHELLLYVFLVLAADRFGLSYYSYDRIVSLLRLSVEEYIEARDRLIESDLIAFDGKLFQVTTSEDVVVSFVPVRAITFAAMFTLSIH
jgi:hypothetical protein